MTVQSDHISLCAVGDVTAFFKNPETMFEHTALILNEADITFGQNERHYSNRYTEKDLLPGLTMTELCPLEHARALRHGGFDVMSFASRHCMDLGADAMMGTIAAIKENGCEVIGAGRNIEEARRPAICERKGTRVAFLAYCSVMRPGWEAGPQRAGCAPMRASTFYEQTDHDPGMPPAIITLANRKDLDALREDLRKVRPLADVVVVSLHWGLRNVRAALAMYQREVAHAAIDAGADLIIGHHPHVLKGIEVYRGKAVFYSMGNFAFDFPLSVRLARSKAAGVEHSVPVDPEYAEHYCQIPEARKSMIVRCRISGKRITRVAFLPVEINSKAQPVVLTREDQVLAALENMRDLCVSQGLDTALAGDRGEIVVST